MIACTCCVHTIYVTLNCGLLAERNATRVDNVPITTRSGRRLGRQIGTRIPPSPESRGPVGGGAYNVKLDRIQSTVLFADPI